MKRLRKTIVPFFALCGLLSVSAAGGATSHRGADVLLQPTTAFNGIRGVHLTEDDLPAGHALINDESQQHEIAYRVERAAGVSEIVSEGRGVRFLSKEDRHVLRLSAPLIIDAAGRPSYAARWTIDRSAGEGRIVIRLRIEDRSLRYPVTVTFSGGARPSSAPPLRPAGQAVGTLTGTVTAVGSGAAIAGATVYVYDAFGEFVTFATTDGNGAYSVPNLEPASYRVLFFAEEFAAELYNNIACADFGCDVSAGTAVVINDGATTANINASLTRNVTQIKGTVASTTGTPLADVTVLAYNSAGTPVSVAVSDAAGQYAVTVPAGGTFYVRTLNSVHDGYVDKLYSGFNCVACAVTSGTPVIVTTGAAALNVDFALDPNGGRISGRITDAATASGLAFRRVEIYHSSGTAVTFADTDSAGNYTSFNGLVPGNYYVLASATGYRSELYDNVACSGCSVITGTPVAVTLGATTPNINIALTNLESRVSGHVRALGTGLALGDVAVLFYDQSGQHVLAAFSDPVTGVYSIVLPRSGVYHAKTANGVHAGYVDQLYSTLDCSGCAVTGGTAITVAAGQNVDNVDFNLANDGGTITGQIRDALTNLPIPFGFVQVYSSIGSLAAYGFANSEGNYTLHQGLTAGSFYILGLAEGYPSEVYNDVTCGDSCNPTAGTAVTVVRGQTTSGINFMLDGTAAIVSGRVMTADGAPLGSIVVSIHDSTGNLVASATSDGTTGDYAVVLPSGGTYYARTHNTAQPQYADQIYDHRPCDDTCDPLTGTPIVVPDAGSATGVDFHLTSSCPTIDIQPASLPEATVNVSYSQQLTSTATVEPITFTISSGSLPSGVTLSSAGLISGTMTSAGSASFTVVATDGNGCTGSRNYTLATALAATSTSLSSSVTQAVYGNAIVLTATVTPSVATGTVSFFAGIVKIGETTLAGGSASLTTSTLSAAVHNLTAVYSGSTSHASSTSPIVVVTIIKATPQITWALPAPITYGTALSGLQLNATADVPGTFAYVPAAGVILDAAPHTLSTTFHPTDFANYDDATAFVPLIVNQAAQTISWANPADIVYGTVLGPTQLNANVSVPGPSPAGALSYLPPAGTLLDAGSHPLMVFAAETSNYMPAERTVTITVLKASPVIDGVSAPSIVVGTPSVTISGTIAADSLIPPGSVVVTVSVLSSSAAIQADGSFAATLATGTLDPVAGGYAVSVSYAGSANFNAASATSVLTVTFGWSGGPLQRNPANRGSTIPIRIRLIDAAGRNLSSEDIEVIAYGVRLVSDTVWLPAESTNSGTAFRFQNAGGGSYLFNLKTTGLVSGSYVLGFRASGDSTIHEIPFSIR